MEKIVTYKAKDGTVFETEADCLAYEKMMSSYIETTAYYEWEDCLDDIPAYLGVSPKDRVFLVRIGEDFYKWIENNNIKVNCAWPINDYKWQTVVLCAESLEPGSIIKIRCTLKALIDKMRIDIDRLSDYL